MPFMHISNSQFINSELMMTSNFFKAAIDDLENFDYNWRSCDFSKRFFQLNFWTEHLIISKMNSNLWWPNKNFCATMWWIKSLWNYLSTLFTNSTLLKLLPVKFLMLFTCDCLRAIFGHKWKQNFACGEPPHHRLCSASSRIKKLLL